MDEERGLVGFHRVSLWKWAAGPVYTAVATGTTAQCPAANTTLSHLRYVLTTAADGESYIIRHWCSTQVSTSDLGAAGNPTGDTSYNGEIYGICEILKV